MEDNFTPNNEQPNPEIQPNKRRRKKSIVWEHFTVETVSAGCTRACCKQCKKSFAYITGSKLAGTSHLKRHIALGICPVSRRNQEKNQLMPYTPASQDGFTGISTDAPKRRYRGTPVYANIPFDQHRCNQEIAKMIIMHDYPLHIVEHSGFINFVHALQPQFNVASFNSIQGDCVALYLREKQNLSNTLNEIPGRVSLTLDMWTSDENLGYVFLTGHFIDDEWKLHRRILNVVMVSSPESDDAYGQAVVACLADWSLESRLFTITLDQSFSSETMMGNLRGVVSVKNPLMFNGQLLIRNCFARILCSLAQDAIGAMADTVKKIRDSVKYVKTSDAHEEKFLELKHQLQVPSTKTLFLNDYTKWNSTYHMLADACELKEVFTCLDTYDPDYKEAPSPDDWRQVETLCTFLKLFYDAAIIFTGKTYPTANTFYHEVWKVQLELTEAAKSHDPFISNLTKPLQDKFDRYWKETSLILAVAVVMDPRFKMKLVEFSFSKIYGAEAEMWIKIVDEGIRELFVDYVTQQPLLSIQPYVDEGSEVISQSYLEEGNDVIPKTEMTDGALLSDSDRLSDFDVYISEISGGQDMRSELDQYLDESLMPRSQDFDVLDWWKLNKLKYPTLSRMASDLLSTPITTVGPDNVFDTVSRKIDRYRSSLRPVTLEALICSKDWLQYPAEPDMLVQPIVKMEF